MAEEISPVCALSCSMGLESERGARVWPGWSTGGRANSGEERTAIGNREEEKVNLTKRR